MPDVEYISYNDLVTKREPAEPKSAPADDAAWLRLGATGDAVKELQHKLNAGGELLAVSGNFGPSTHEAVRRLQLKHGIPPDGIVNAATQRALDGGGDGEAPSRTPAFLRKKLPPSKIPPGQDWFLASSQRVLPDKDGGADRARAEAEQLLSDINKQRYFRGKG